jgi:predicted nucleotidyltransferase
MKPDLPPVYGRALDDFVEAAKSALRDQLKSVVLYGSGAEGRLRATSDVNVILVLSTFDRTRIDALREPVRVANAAIKLTAMFLLEAEVASAAETFAVKFSDVLRRRVVLAGSDPFQGITISKPAEITRLRQVLFNLTLRMRSIYAERSLREEQLALAIADFAGPLRASAAAILELQGVRANSPKEALEQLAGSLDSGSTPQTFAYLSEAREKAVLPPGIAAQTAFQLMGLAERMRKRVEAL